MNEPQPIVTRVDLLESATLTLIHKQDAMHAELRNVSSRLDRIENTLQLLVQMFNERLPKKSEE